MPKPLNSAMSRPWEGGLPLNKKMLSATLRRKCFSYGQANPASPCPSGYSRNGLYKLRRCQPVLAESQKVKDTDVSVCVRIEC